MKLRKKINILGDFAVGKTSLVRRYVLDEFSEDYFATLGVNIYKHQTRAGAGAGAPRDVALVIWDVEGNGDRADLLASYLQGAAGAIIVGDMTRPESIEAMHGHAETFLDHLPGRPLVFAFNKVDLVGPELPEDAGAALVREFGGLVLHTSAKEGTEVPALFTGLVDRIIEVGA